MKGGLRDLVGVQLFDFGVLSFSFFFFGQAKKTGHSIA